MVSSLLRHYLACQTFSVCPMQTLGSNSSLSLSHPAYECSSSWLACVARPATKPQCRHLQPDSRASDNLTLHVLHQQPYLQENDFMCLSIAADAFIVLLCLNDFRLRGILIMRAANRVIFCFLILSSLIRHNV